MRSNYAIVKMTENLCVQWEIHLNLFGSVMKLQ